MMHIFVDYEMNEINKSYREQRAICKREIIEIGAVKLDDTGKEVDSFTQYVKPQFGKITEYYQKLTGISNEMVADKPNFHEAMVRFYEWAGTEEYTIYSWSDSDIFQISKEAALKNEKDERLTYMLEHWIDYQEKFGKILGVERKVSLMDAVHAIGKQFDGKQHDALWDARNTSEIYRLSLDERKFKVVMQPIVDLFNPQKKIGATLGELFGSEFSNLFS